MEQAPRQPPGNALNLAFMALLCLVINYIIAESVIIVLCFPSLGLESHQGKNFVCLVHGRASWHSAWYTTGAYCRAPCFLRSSLCEIFIHLPILSAYSGPGTVLIAGEAAAKETKTLASWNLSLIHI